jgi:integrase
VSSSTKRALDKVYNTDKSKDAMLETKYLFQPRGQGTAWHFRMPTPSILVGETNPFTGKPFSKSETRIGLGGTHNLKQARMQRDQILAAIRKLEADQHKGKLGTLSNAAEVAAQYAELPADADDDQRDAWREAIELDAERLAKKIGPEKASRWYRVATGIEVASKSLKEVFEEYRAARTGGKKDLSQSSINNLRTAEKEFLAFAGDEIELHQVTWDTARKFIEEYLPQQKSAKAPQGQGPATIVKKLTLLRGVWQWAKLKKGYLPRDHQDPWDGLGPSDKEIDDAKQSRRPFRPAETVKLFAAVPARTALGDIIRVALLTGVRLEELASLDAAQVDAKARWYFIQKGKTKNAARIIPLVQEAQEIIARRLKAAGNAGPLFPELPLRKSTGKRGGAITKAFTRTRRDVLGKETDGELAVHCFRHTWRTAARQAEIDLRNTQEMGGWSRGKDTDLHYDFGLKAQQYRRDQLKVARWLEKEGYFGKARKR